MFQIGKVIIAFFVMSSYALAVDIQISQLTDSPDPAVRGGEITYAIAILNNANDTAVDVVLTMPMPNKTTFVSVNNANCSLIAGIPDQVICNFGNITGNGLGGPITNVEVVLKTDNDAPGTIAYTATGTTTSIDSNAANDSLTQNTTINSGADLRTTMTDSSDPVVAGSNLSYIITAENQGPNDAATVTLVDTLPVGLTFVSASGTGWSCGAVGQVVTCTRALITDSTFAPNITVTGKITGAISGTITNVVTISAVTGDPDPNNNTTTENTLVNTGADLLITKTASSPVIASGAVTFTLAPRNNGPFDAATVVVSDLIPGNVAYILASGPGWSCSHTGELTGGTVSCTRTTYTVGATDNITITATGPAVGGFTNTATISSATADPNNGNNSDSSVSTIVPDGADLALTKTKTPDPVAQGSNITSTIVIQNLGPQATSGTLTVTDSLDAGETFSSFSGVNWACTHNAVNPGGVVSCTYAATPLAASASATNLLIVTTATNTGNLTNSATVIDVGGQPDNVGGNETGNATVTSTANIADLSVVKAATTLSGNTILEVAENTLTYTLTVTNNGPDSLTATVADAVLVRDVIPGFVSGVAGATPSATAVSVSDDSAGRFTCTTGSTVNCRLNNGSTFANLEVITFTITVDRPLSNGALTNTATVSSAQLGDDVPGNNSSSAGVTVDPIADVQIDSVTVNPDPVEAGTEATYVIAFRNNGPSSAANVQVVNTFVPPVGRTYTLVSSSTSKGSCAALVGNSLTCSIGSLSRNETESITLIVRPDWDVNNTAWILADNVMISTSTDESNGGNNAGSVNLGVSPAELDLLVNKTDLTDPLGWTPTPNAFPGSLDNVIVYRVDITNSGPSLATTVILQDAMTPKNGKTLTFLCDDVGAASCNAGTALCNNINASIVGPATLNISCTLPNLNASASTIRHLFFKIDSAPDSTGDTHSNIATILSSEDDTQPANDSESETTSVRARVDIGVTKNPSTAIVDLFQNFDWDIVVNNNGPGDSAGSTLADSLPAGSELTGPPIPAQGTCTGVAGNTSYNCSLGTINNGASVIVTVPVRVTVFPAGGTLTNTATVDTFGVDDNAANDSNSGVVTVRRSSIAGTVFNDINDDGDQDAGDSGIAAVTITLAGTDAYGNVINRNTNTMPNGDYLFSNVSVSDANGYSLSEAQPTGFADGLESINGVIEAGSRSTDVISNIAVAINTNLVAYDFAELGQIALSGFVWVDENNDGVKDAAETTNIAGVQITLTGVETVSGITVNDATTTATDGSYRFSDLRAGTYILAETQPTTWADGIDSIGNFGGVVGADQFSNIVLNLLNTAVNYNFGEVGASLSGSVYRDTDDDGVFDGAEVGIGNVNISLTGLDDLGNVANRATTTDGTGNYIFEHLPKANGVGYSIQETQPDYLDGKDAAGSLGGDASVNDLISAIPVIAGATGIDYHFGESGKLDSSIAGTIFTDFNDDGLQQSIETGIENVTVRLTATDAFGNNVDSTTITDVNGDYLFNSLALSDGAGYSISETQPFGFKDGLDSIAAVIEVGSRSTDVITSTILTENTQLTDHDFAEVPIPSISGTIWIDTNNDGVIDANETIRLEGVTLVLTGNDRLSNAVNLTTFTDASGNYIFANILPSDASGYRLTETQPVLWADGKESLGSINGVENGSVGADVFNNIVISGSQAGINYNFAEVGATLSGNVFSDINNDGLKDADEKFLANVSLTLSGTTSIGASVCSVACPVLTTDNNGHYSFIDLASGIYKITETQPLGYANGIETAGSLGGTSGTNLISDIPVTAGANGIEYNFAEIAIALSGSVYVDANDNGIREPEETGIAEVIITLTGIDVTGSVVNETTKTGTNGDYLFVGLPPSDLTGYTLTETQPDSWVDGNDSVGTAGGVVVDDVISSIVLQEISTASEYNFAEIAATLSGSVYVDANSNGIKEPEETGIAEVTITLTGIDATGIAVNETTKTGTNGDYLFVGLPPSDLTGYTLTETQPEGWVDGIDTVGTAGGVVTDDVISSIVLQEISTASDYNFAETAVTLSGSVYVDANNNGIKEPEETGIAEVIITLSGTDASGTAINETTNTDMSGDYEFVGLPPSDLTGYTLTETQPEGWADGIDSVGTAGGVLADDVISSIVLQEISTASDYNFGELAGELLGTVYIDTNNNGTPQADELRLENITITLSGINDLAEQIEQITTTDADGHYRFAELRPGTYSINETQPTQFSDGIVSAGSLGGRVGVNIISEIILASGDIGIDYNFGELIGSIAGSVYLDSNQNGIRDVEEIGISNVSLNLSGTDQDGNSFSAQVLTDVNGNFLFAGLPPSDDIGYIISETQPDAWADGEDVAGSAGGVVSNDSIGSIIVSLTTAATGYDFGEVGGSLSGTVFSDLNNEGVQSPNEPGIPNVILELTGTAVDGSAILITVLTSADGSYIFKDLPLPDASGYTITETQPEGMDDGIVTSGSFGGVVGVNVITGITLPQAGADGIEWNFAEIASVISEISGRIWLDINHNKIDDEIVTGREGWVVQLVIRDGLLASDSVTLVATVMSDSNGDYLFTGLVPGTGYEVRFLHPVGGYLYGGTVSDEPGANTEFGAIRNLTLIAGDHIVDQNLPLDPSGVVYDSVTRVPVANARVTLEGPAGFDADIHLVGGSDNLLQITSDNGEYQYLLFLSAPVGNYNLTVIEPSGYVPGGSSIIPVCDNVLNVVGTPDPALVQDDPSPPELTDALHDAQTCPQDSSTLAASDDSTQYYLRFILTPGVSANLLSNHIPVDPFTDGAITVVKTSPKITVTRGEMVPYSVRFSNNINGVIAGVDLIDQIPPGFKYVKGTSSVDGIAVEPIVNGRQLTWENFNFATGDIHLVKLILVVGSGVGDGEYTNLAWANISAFNQRVSTQGSANVRVVPDPTFDCTDIIGKVFDDQNLNGYQDKGEPGLAGVRVVSARGLLVTSDAEGRYHIACAAVANEIHGSNFILKLDERTLPAGYRVTTENPRVTHISRGKLTKLNFGAAIHRVVRVELSTLAFMENATELTVETKNKQQQLLQLLSSKASVLRLAYHFDDEKDDLINNRLDRFVENLETIWNQCDCGYELIIEKEIIMNPQKIPAEVQQGGIDNE